MIISVTTSRNCYQFVPNIDLVHSRIRRESELRSRENTGNGRVPGSLSGRTWIHSNWGKLKTQSQKWVEKRGFILLLFILNDFILLFILNDFTYNKLYTSLNTLHKMDGNLDKPELENRMRSGNYQIQWKKLHQLLLHDRSYSVLKLLKWT